MLHQFSRTELAIGEEGLERLKNASVAVLGLGGVGSFAAEALARSAIGRLILIDRDDVEITNINRQIHALLTTIGRSKAELMKERIAQINPVCDVIALKMFYTPETAEQLFIRRPDYIIDAMDTMTAKIHLILEAKRRGIPIISSMGAANKMDPTKFQVADISKTHTDPIARVIRQKLRKHRIYRGVRVVFSTEKPLRQRPDVLEKIVPRDVPNISKAKLPPASNAFVPPIPGLIMAGEVVNALLRQSVPECV